VPTQGLGYAFKVADILESLNVFWWGLEMHAAPMRPVLDIIAEKTLGGKDVVAHT